MRPRLPVACLLGAWLVASINGCRDLAEIEEGICGNKVLDTTEDCDHFEDATLGSGLVCGDACRYVCSGEAKCPTDWDCGLDKVCRHASDELQLAPQSTIWTPDNFAPLDFNGDGRVDLAGAFAEHIEFRLGALDGTFPAAFTMATDPVGDEIVAGDFDGDGYGDALLPNPAGFLLWRGQREGPPLQAAFGTLQLSAEAEVWAVPLAYPAFGLQGVLAILVSVDGTLTRILFDYRQSTFTPTKHAISDAAVHDLGDRVPTADFDGDGDEEIVLALPGAEAVEVYGVFNNLATGKLSFDGFGAASPAEPLAIEVGPGLSVAGGALATDVDGDESPDLLIRVSGSGVANDAVMVARWGGDGFEPPYLDPRFDLLASPSTAPDPADAGELSSFPLAATDIDGDLAADYVSQHGVFLSSVDELVQTHRRQSPSAWTVATFADVDGDSRPDIVAARAGEPIIDVLRCGDAVAGCVVTGDYTLAVRYDAGMAVKKIRTGRLQGPPTDDIAVIGSLGEGEGDALGVLYAKPSGWPDEVVRHVRFETIEQMEISPARLPGQLPVDAIEDVQLTARSGGAATYTQLYSDGRRQLNSPLVLPDTPGGVSFSSGRGAFFGRFADEGSSSPQAVFIGEREGAFSRIWWAPAVGDGRFVPSVTANLQDRLDGSFDLECARFSSGDLDGDGLAEVVILFGGAICDGAETTLARARVEDAAFVFETTELPIATSDLSTQVVVADIEGDSAAELIVLQPGVATVWSDGEDPRTLALPDGEAIVDAVSIVRSPNGRVRLAILTDASIVVVGSARGLAVEIEIPAVAKQLQSADIDGNGLGDLFLLGPNGIDVLLSVEATPLGSAQ